MRISDWSSDVCSSDLKFKIRDPATTAGDDYAMMREVLTRRFQRALKEDPERSCNQWPDLVLLDGGQGQLTVSSEVLHDLCLGDLPIAALPPGPDRDVGRERTFLSGQPALLPHHRAPALYSPPPPTAAAAPSSL